MTEIEWKIENWVTMQEAVKATRRQAQTVRLWVKAGKVRTYRPGEFNYFYLPDLLVCEKDSQSRNRS